MTPDADELEDLLLLRPQGRFDINEVGDMLQTIRESKANLELNLSDVETLDVCALQFVLVVFSSLRQRNRRVVVIDSEAGVLRSLLNVAGIGPELAGLSPRLTL